MSTTTICCNQCLATNRIPSDRLGDEPICGNCKKPLFQGDVIELSASNLSSVIYNNQIPVVVDCWAPWCGPCRSFAPIFAQAAQEMEPHFRFAKLNTEQHQQISAQWNIRSIPTLLVFKDGQEVNRMSGALPLAQFKQWLQK